MPNKNENDGSKSLHKHTEDALEVYFESLNGDRPGDLYELVMGEVERPLFKAVLDYTQGNHKATKVRLREFSVLTAVHCVRNCVTTL